MIPGVDSILMLSRSIIPDPGVHPTISLVWADDLGTQDRNCTDTSCPFTIKSIVTNPLGVAVTTKIQESTDNAASWFDVTNLQTYSDAVTDKTKIYRAVVLTSTTPYYSNILKYEKQTVPPNITAINVVNNSGQTSYDLVVAGATFYGYIIISGKREMNIKNVQIDHLYDGNQKDFTVPNNTPYGTKAYSFASMVTIPVGVYPNCQLMIFGNPILIGSHSASASCEVSYSSTVNFDDGILIIDAYRFIEGD